MLVSFNWLQDYVDIPWSPEELADRLTMAGLEVEGIQNLNPGLNNVYVGLVSELIAHPDADALSLCTVDVGELGVFQIVCGAPNVRAGQKVPVALEGAVLPGGLQIKPTDIRGITSNGMICSEEELNIGEGSDGIMVLPDDSPLGDPIVDVLGLDDTILDVTIYANRPDCMGMIGIAREVAALVGTTIRYPSIEYTEEGSHIDELTSVEVLDEKKCPRYTAKMIKEITITQSPLWMQTRLRAAGMRPINNIVDITNYVMLELGQPLHAFDYETLAERRIVVRTPQPGETMTTLDGEVRELTEEMLLICDAEKPICIAGVMGGLETEVTPNTQTILLEAANFNPVSVRRASRTLGISSESAARFEKGITPHGTEFAAQRAMHLLATYANGKVSPGTVDRNTGESANKQIAFSPESANRLAGIEIPEKEMCTALNGLEFAVDDSQIPWLVTIPPHRSDIELEADIIEEVIRIWGYEKIPTTFPKGETTVGGQTARLAISDYYRDILVGCGLQEAITYSFIRPDSNKRMQQADGPPMMKLHNPISEDLSAMRTSILPGLLVALSVNCARQQERTALYEVGPVYLQDLHATNKQPREELRVGISLFGNRYETNWATSQSAYDFFDLKGILELLLAGEEFTWERGDNPTFHPGRQGLVKYAGKTVAVYGEFHPAVLREYKISGKAYGAEIDLDALLDHFGQSITYKALPKYPRIDRDLAIIVDQEQPVGNIMDLLRAKGGELLQGLRIFDIYEGQQVPSGKKSVAFSLRFQADRNLVEQEINAIMESLVKELTSTFGAEIR